jgi:hypothetical protein
MWPYDFTYLTDSNDHLLVTQYLYWEFNKYSLFLLSLILLMYIAPLK